MRIADLLGGDRIKPQNIDNIYILHFSDLQLEKAYILSLRRIAYKWEILSLRSAKTLYKLETLLLEAAIFKAYGGGVVYLPRFLS